MPVTVNKVTWADLRMNFQVPRKHFLLTANKNWPELQHLVCGGLFCTVQESCNSTDLFERNQPSAQIQSAFWDRIWKINAAGKHKHVLICAPIKTRSMLDMDNFCT